MREVYDKQRCFAWRPAGAATARRSPGAEKWQLLLGGSGLAREWARPDGNSVNALPSELLVQTEHDRMGLLVADGHHHTLTWIDPGLSLTDWHAHLGRAEGTFDMP